MGIPSFFKETIQNYPEIIIPHSTMKFTIDYLFLDLNCAIHPCCANQTDESIMFSTIFEKIKECIHITNVSKCIYIVIDGPAPRTKMEQQRQRRLKSSLESKQWDTNAITPGTKFMNKLSTFLQTQCKSLSIDFILSDANQPGEGEHKIMKYIDTLPNDSIHCVYGLDADLIILSMIRRSKIFLLRERTSYNIEQILDPYLFLDTHLLQKCIVDSLTESISTNLSSTRLLNDYIFLCFLLGNDFIIPSPSINIRYNGIQQLLQTYKDIHKDYYGTFYLLTEDNDIYLPHFLVLLEKLSMNETQQLQHISTIRHKQQQKLLYRYEPFLKYYQSKKMSIQDIIYDKPDLNNFKICSRKKNIEYEYTNFKNNIPLLYRDNKETEIIKNNYYQHQTNINDPIYLQPHINELSKDYLCSIYWTTHYYFKECLCWKWYYPHIIAPLLHDVYSYCKQLNSMCELFTHTCKTPYSPEKQLCIVLPKKSHNLLQNKSELFPLYYYPHKTPIHIFMKRFLWECHPILPHNL